MPTARPTMLASASGALKTRSSPYSRCRPCVSLKTPPLPGHDAAARPCWLASATSSPKTTMRGSRAISSFSVRLIAADHRVGLAFGLRPACRRRPTSDRRRASRPRASARAPRRLRRGERLQRGVVDFALDVGGDAPRARRRSASRSPSGTRRSARSDRAALRPRARPAACTASRRRTASASTGG